MRALISFPKLILDVTLKLTIKLKNLGTNSEFLLCDMFSIQVWVNLMILLAKNNFLTIIKFHYSNPWNN